MFLDKLGEARPLGCAFALSALLKQHAEIRVVPWPQCRRQACGNFCFDPSHCPISAAFHARRAAMAQHSIIGVPSSLPQAGASANSTRYHSITQGYVSAAPLVLSWGQTSPEFRCESYIANATTDKKPNNPGVPRHPFFLG